MGRRDDWNAMLLDIFVHKNQSTTSTTGIYTALPSSPALRHIHALDHRSWVCCGDMPLRKNQSPNPTSNHSTNPSIHYNQVSTPPINQPIRQKHRRHELTTLKPIRTSRMTRTRSTCTRSWNTSRRHSSGGNRCSQSADTGCCY